ncbi:MAG: hypothetical protein HYZ91_03545 [Candidatus Omnitrophica bacterium]|nr:hypothetical protein [Candidatus Omnitrophota bacterium]
MSRRRIERTIFLLMGVLTVRCWWRIRLLGDVRLHLAAFYGGFTLAFLFYLLLLWLISRAEKFGTFLFFSNPRFEKNGDVSMFSSKNRNVPNLLVVGLVAIAARLLLIGTTPTLSDDLYRYRWDGRVQLAGVDPYAYPPNHPALGFLRDAESSRINFPHLRTVYPPLAELAFRLGASVNKTLIGQKAVFVCAELVTALSLLVLLRCRGRSLLWVAAYAWHPLAILEIAGSGHNDALGVAALWLGIAAWQARRWWGCALAWAAAFLSKFVSAVLAPWWWCRGQARGWLAVFGLASALPLAMHPNAVTALVQSLTSMTTRGSSNASLYLVLMGLLRHEGLARLVVVVALGGFLVWWAKREADPIRYVAGAVAAAALLSPVLHPWYLLWLVPCLCFWRPAPFLALTGTVVLSYTVWPGYLTAGRWAMPAWARVAEYAPVMLLGLWETRRCAWRSFFLPETKPKPLVES